MIKICGTVILLLLTVKPLCQISGHPPVVCLLSMFIDNFYNPLLLGQETLPYSDVIYEMCCI